MNRTVRNATSTDKKPAPKAPTKEKKKLSDKRQAARDEAAGRPKRYVRKDQREILEPEDIEFFELADEEKPKLKKAADRYALTEEDLQHRHECLEAIEKATVPTRDEIFDASLEKFEKSLIKNKVSIIDSFGTPRDLSEPAFEALFYGEGNLSQHIAPSRTFFVKVAEELVLKMNDDPALRQAYYPDKKKKGSQQASATLANRLISSKTSRGLKKGISAACPFPRWLSYVAENDRYPFVKPYLQAMDAVSEHAMRDYSSPEDKRRFVLDVGPTNSGKTYAGMQRLISAKSGVYLGPLRLLAMEVAEEINEAGVPCDMLTGEEHSKVEGAHHVASTVEMLDRSARYEVAVIDECQMMTDPERGYAWARAIVSVNAEVVHLCMAPEAEKLVVGMLEGLGEEYEVVHHERLVPLQATKAVRWPVGIKKGDAVVVFSRRSVQQTAAYLESRGMRASVVYGALPYDVRREEVRKFMDGETDVVVATDAIGMGMNLPVRRVVFLETEKYDGHCSRQLLPSEIKQIAGRAGRYGKYDTGYATGANRAAAELVSSALAAPVQGSSEIRMDMPYKVVSLPLPLAMLMRAWQLSPLPYPYVKRDLKQEIALARRVIDLPNDFIAAAVEIPFKSGDRFVPLDDMWEAAVRAAAAGKKPKIQLYEVDRYDSLLHLEDAAKVADLAYGIAKRYGDEKDLKRVEKNRKAISKEMIKRLKSKDSEYNYYNNDYYDMY